VLDVVPDPSGEEILVSNPQPKHAIANCSQTVSPVLPPGEYKSGELATAIPPFAK